MNDERDVSAGKGEPLQLRSLQKPERIAKHDDCG